MGKKEPMLLREKPHVGFVTVDLYTDNSRTGFLKYQRREAEALARRYFDDPSFERVELRYKGATRGMFWRRSPAARHEFVEAFVRLPLYEEYGEVGIDLWYRPQVTVPRITLASIITPKGATFADILSQMGERP